MRQEELIGLFLPLPPPPPSSSALLMLLITVQLAVIVRANVPRVRADGE